MADSINAYNFSALILGETARAISDLAARDGFKSVGHIRAARETLSKETVRFISYTDLIAQRLPGESEIGLKSITSDKRG